MVAGLRARIVTGPKRFPGVRFVFISSFFFSFSGKSVLSFFEKFSYSDLSKIKAVHFWSLKVCLEAKTQRFCGKMEEENNL
jgi:hypothetical protein